MNHCGVHSCGHDNALAWQGCVLACTPTVSSIKHKSGFKCAFIKIVSLKSHRSSMCKESESWHAERNAEFLIFFKRSQKFQLSCFKNLNELKWCKMEQGLITQQFRWHMRVQVPLCKRRFTLRSTCVPVGYLCLNSNKIPRSHYQLSHIARCVRRPRK